MELINLLDVQLHNMILINFVFLIFQLPIYICDVVYLFLVYRIHCVVVVFLFFGFLFLVVQYEFVDLHYLYVFKFVYVYPLLYDYNFNDKYYNKLLTYSMHLFICNFFFQI